MKIETRGFIVAVLFSFIIVSMCGINNNSLLAQTVKIRDLPSAPTPSLLDYLPEANVSGISTTYKVTPNALFALRSISCTPPLLCDGGAAMTLGANRTLSLSPFYLPLSGATMTGNITFGDGFGPVSPNWIVTPAASASNGINILGGSAASITGATNEGTGRKSVFSIYNTDPDDVSSAAIVINGIQRTNAGSACITRTGIHIKMYTQPDNGCDTSGGLVIQSGGGSGLSVYKLHTLRPTGFTDYSSSIQGALEAGTNDQSQAGLFMSGINIGGTTTNSSTALLARIDNSTSRGIVIQPNDNVFDTRDGLVIGTAQINAAPINQQFSLKLNGQATWTSSGNTFQILSTTMPRLSNSTNDGTDSLFSFVKSRNGGSVNTNENIGDIAWNFVNSSSVEKQTAILRVIATDKTADSEDADLVAYLMANGTITERFRVSSIGNISAANFSGSSSGTNTGDQIIPVNTAATGSNWFSAYDSATGAFTKSRPAMADLSDASTWKGWTDSGTTVNTTTSTDKVGIGTSSADSLLEVTANAATLQTPTLTGTVAHFSSADGTSSRLLIDSYGTANPATDYRASGGTAAAPSAVGSGVTIGQTTWAARGTTVYPSSPGATINGVTEETQTDSAHGIGIVFKTTPLGSSTNREVLRIDAAGHILSSGAAPTVACTGTGTSPSAPTIDSGGTDHKFTATINTGTGSPGSTGTCTVTFATVFTAIRPVVCMLVKGGTAWGNTSQIQETTESSSAPVFTWTNSVGGVATALSISTSYKFSCITIG